jgi:hypothetical protein
MSTNNEGLTWTGKWRIVRADLDLAHVFAPQDEISFTKDPSGAGYTVQHTGSAPDARAFGTAVLRAVDGAQPSFDALSVDYPLPLFSRHHKHRYRSLADKIEAFAQKNPAVRHLEGSIEMPCHRYPHQAQESDSDEHAVKTIRAPIRVYQFANALERKEKRLFVIYKPLHPSCGSNGNGTVIGYD